MKKTDFKKSLKEFYSAPTGDFVAIDVPPMRFVMVDGQGDPNTAASYRTAVEALYAVSYGLKFAVKASAAIDYVVPPLEGVWHADDPAAFAPRRKGEWKWTMMIMAPDPVDQQMFEAARAKARRKLGELPAGCSPRRPLPPDPSPRQL